MENKKQMIWIVVICHKHRIWVVIHLIIFLIRWSISYKVLVQIVKEEIILILYINLIIKKRIIVKLMKIVNNIINQIKEKIKVNSKIKNLGKNKILLILTSVLFNFGLILQLTIQSYCRWGLLIKNLSLKQIKEFVFSIGKVMAIFF